jgi:hypothetical protein
MHRAASPQAVHSRLGDSKSEVHSRRSCSSTPLNSIIQFTYAFANMMRPIRGACRAPCASAVHQHKFKPAASARMTCRVGDSWNMTNCVELPFRTDSLFRTDAQLQTASNDVPSTTLSRVTDRKTPMMAFCSAPRNFPLHKLVDSTYRMKYVDMHEIIHKL